MRLVFRLVGLVLLLGLQTLPAEAAEPPLPSVEWLQPTPASGTALVMQRGTTVTVVLAARALDGSAVVITQVGPVPQGAQVVSTPGNPASATLSFKADDAGFEAFSITFSAAAVGAPDAASIAVTYLIRPADPPRPQTFRLTGPGPVSRWATVLRPVIARQEPRMDARPVTPLSTTTPDGTQNIVLLLKSWVGETTVWVRVRLPILPNNSTGWVPRASLGEFHEVNTHLYLDRTRLRAVLYRAGKPVFRARVGIGRPYWPTPRGEFYIRNKLLGFGDPFYGPVAFGTNARSAVLTDWPAGGFVGIHGTSSPEILPGRVSHGCIRMVNSDILRLARLMPVGTPLTIS
jgi:hypothetical protein